ncbi:MAG: ORF6N domain-containing protein [Candidatus Omnitrophota bacterium]
MKKEQETQNMIPRETIENRILLIREKKVMLDSDLAKMYGVLTKSLNLAVKRNIARFPEDFMFQLSKQESESLRFHFETSKRGGRRYCPYAFTEHGILMLSSVLKSERAIQVNIAIMRVFVKLKEMLSTHKDLVCKLDELERKVENQDKEIHYIFEAIRQLMAPPPAKPKRTIGFHSY